jgi:hypothetical protein
MNLVTSVKDFGKGLKVIFGKPEAGEGDRKLAKAANMVYGQIAVYGKDAVARSLIKSIETDMKRFVKNGGQERVEKEIQNCLDTPEYMKLLKKLGMGEPNLRVLAIQVIQKYGEDK